jgi:hypothetical protein
MHMKKLSLFVFVFGLIVAGCGGGGNTSNPSSRAQFASGNATILIPAGTAQAVQRGTKFVSSGVFSGRLAISGLADQFFNLSPTSNACVSNASGRTCTIVFNAPVGQSTATLTLYDGASGAGNVLGSATTTLNFTAQGPNSVSFTVNGQIASISVVSVNANGAGCVVIGQASTTTLIFTAKDAQGNIITGPGNYATPITITTSSSAFSASPNPLNNPGVNVTGTYNGAAFTSPATFTATAGSVTVTYQVFAGTSSPTGCTIPPSGAPSATPSTTPGPSSTPTPSPSPSPSAAPPTGVPNPLLNCTAPALSAPGPWTTISLLGNVNSGTFTPASQSGWLKFNYGGSPTPVPTATATPTAGPTPTSSPQPVNVYLGTYTLTSGTTGCMYIVTSVNGAPLNFLSSVGSFNAGGVGIPKVNAAITTLASSGTISSTNIILNATGGSGTISLSNGDTGTISLSAPYQSTVDKIRKPTI